MKLNLINLLINNWKIMIMTCNEYIEKGIEVEFYKKCKEQCTQGYHKAYELLDKEIVNPSFPEISDESENGSYQADEDDRRETEREELELYNH